MEDIVASRRQDNIAAISENPTNVQINRKIKSDTPSGGKAAQPITLPDQTIRVFKVNADAKETTNEAGKIKHQRWGALCRYDANILAEDTFTTLQGKFLVKNVNKIIVKDQIVSLQVELDEVS
jgi:hypothetical protein